MTELNSGPVTKPFASARNTEAASLKALIDELNNPEIEGTEIPVEAVKPPLRKSVVPTAPAIPANAAPLPQRLFFTGRLAVGKDFVADQIGGTKVGFADPLYAVVSELFNITVTGTSNKDLPGMRKMLQLIGQWGRNVVSPEYPYTGERALLCESIRALGRAGKLPGYVNWESFGQDNNLWVDGLIRRVSQMQPEERIINTNVRFEFEFKALAAEQFEHFHIMCDPATMTARLAAKGLKFGAPELRDISEQLAISLDADVTKQISQHRAGKKLRVIWNSSAPAPSPRFYSVAEFLARK